MISLPDTLNDAVTWVRLKRRLWRQIRKLEQNTPALNAPRNSVVLLGPSRSGKSSIAREMEAQGVLCHCEVDIYIKYLNSFSNNFSRSYAAEYLLMALLHKYRGGFIS